MFGRRSGLVAHTSSTDWGVSGCESLGFNFGSMRSVGSPWIWRSASEISDCTCEHHRGLKIC